MTMLLNDTLRCIVHFWLIWCENSKSVKICKNCCIKFTAAFFYGDHAVVMTSSSRSWIFIHLRLVALDDWCRLPTPPLLPLSAPTLTLTLTLTFAVEVTWPGDVTPSPALLVASRDWLSWKHCGTEAPPPVRLLNVNGHVWRHTHAYASPDHLHSVIFSEYVK